MCRQLATKSCETAFRLVSNALSFIRKRQEQGHGARASLGQIQDELSDLLLSIEMGFYGAVRVKTGEQAEQRRELRQRIRIARELRGSGRNDTTRFDADLARYAQQLEQLNMEALAKQVRVMRSDAARVTRQIQQERARAALAKLSPSAIQGMVRSGDSSHVSAAGSAAAATPTTAATRLMASRTDPGSEEEDDDGGLEDEAATPSTDTVRSARGPKAGRSPLPPSPAALPAAANTTAAAKGGWALRTPVESPPAASPPPASRLLLGRLGEGLGFEDGKPPHLPSTAGLPSASKPSSSAAAAAAPVPPSSRQQRQHEPEQAGTSREALVAEASATMVRWLGNLRRTGCSKDRGASLIKPCPLGYYAEVNALRCAAGHAEQRLASMGRSIKSKRGARVPVFSTECSAWWAALGPQERHAVISTADLGAHLRQKGERRGMVRWVGPVDMLTTPFRCRGVRRRGGGPCRALVRPGSVQRQ